MKKTIKLEVVSAHRETKEPFELPKVENEQFVGVSGLDCGLYSANIDVALQELGWRIYGNAKASVEVLIDLPEDVKDGEFRFRNCDFDCLHTDYAANDGKGCIVVVYLPQPVQVINKDYGAAFAQAIKEGICLEIPQKNGKRRIEKAKIVKVGDIQKR
jgi:hypothetical protein